MIKYYVIRNKSTGMYFRGKGENRWGRYYNQASIYRMKAHADNTFRWLSLRGEPVEIVPIQILENANDAVEVVHGRWIEKEYVDEPYGGYYLFHCSECGIPNERERNYCPNCGAIMEG